MPTPNPTILRYLDLALQAARAGCETVDESLAIATLCQCRAEIGHTPASIVAKRAVRKERRERVDWLEIAGPAAERYTFLDRHALRDAKRRGIARPRLFRWLY